MGPVYSQFNIFLNNASSTASVAIFFSKEFTIPLKVVFIRRYIDVREEYVKCSYEASGKCSLNVFRGMMNLLSGFCGYCRNDSSTSLCGFCCIWRITFVFSKGLFIL